MAGIGELGGARAGGAGVAVGHRGQRHRLGVLYWKLDAEKYENHPELEKIRKGRNYSRMDIITTCKDKRPNYED